MYLKMSFNIVKINLEVRVMKTTVLLKKLFIVKYFFIGLAAAFLLHLSGSCNKDRSNPIAPDNNDDNAEIAIIEEGAKSAETAFLSGDVNSIKNIFTDDAKELYGTDISQIDKNHFIKLGEALKTKELKVYTGLYAEYDYTKDGITYTFAMAKQEDGSWKLMRF